MSESNFHRNHAQHIHISEWLSEDIKKAVQDLLSQINNLNQKTSDQLLIKVINMIVSGIYGAIPDLQEIVIKSTSEHENNADLKDMINKLSEYCSEMVEDYDSDSNTLTIKFQKYVKNILLYAESLLNIIKKNNHHDFKHELVECLKEIMYSIELGAIRMRIENYNEGELRVLIEKAQKEYFEEISVMEKCTLKVLIAMDRNVKFNTKHAFKLAYLYNKVASNFEDIDIQRKMLNAGIAFNSVVAAVLNEKFTDIKAAFNAFQDCCIHGWKVPNELFEYNDICFENNKNSENLREVIKMAISYGFLLTKNLGRGINQDCVFALLQSNNI